MAFSDNYQKFLDKINNRIPIKGITSKIDKIHPLFSFFVFVIILLVIISLIFFTGNSNTVEYKDVTIKLMDSNNNILKDYDFKIRDAINTRTYSTDSSGKKVVSLKKNIDYEFILDNEGYAYLSKTINTNQLEYKITAEILNIPDFENKTFTLVDDNTKEVIDENVDISITCINGETITPENLKAKGGKYSFDVPNNCGDIVLNARSNDYATEGLVIKENQSIVSLDKKGVSVGKGDLRFTVKAEGVYVSDITARLFSSDDTVNPIKTKKTVYGIIRFEEIEVGDYKVVFSDSTGKYTSKSIDISVTKDSTQKEIINLTKDQESIVNTKKINVIARDSSNTILDSTEINEINILEENETLIDTKQDNNAEFSIDENKNYFVVVKADGYISKNKNIDVSNNTIYVDLEEKTISNVSDINATIKDEDGEFVDNANVIIYNKDTGIDPRFDPKTTDQNGFVSFEDIPNDNYYLKVKKGYLEGESDLFAHVTPDDSLVNVDVTIGEGSLEFVVKNSFGDIMPNALVEVYTDYGELVKQDYVDSSGVFSVNIKADKTVYAKVTNTDYMDYYTNLIPILKDNSISRTIKISSDYVSDTPHLEYLGAYNFRNQEVSSFENNQVYNFKFKFISLDSSDNQGMIFKVGDKDNVLDDVVSIKPIDNLLTNAIITYFDKYPYTSNVLVGSKANLVDIKFNSIQKGVYEVDVPVIVKNARLEDEIPINYKTYIKSAGEYLTDPETSTTINTKSDLKTLDNYNKEEYYVGVDEICSSLFCISGQYLDVDNDLIYDIPTDGVLDLKVNNNYRLDYSIKNSKSIDYKDIRFSILNKNQDNNPTDSISIKSYDISGEIQKSDSTSSHFFKVPYNDNEITSSQFGAYKQTDIELFILPKFVENSILNNRLISNKQEIYNYNFNINSRSEKELDISYNPKNIAPYTSFNLEVLVKEEDGVLVDDAIVSVYQKINNHLNVIESEAYTNEKGIVNISMPSLNLGETIVIEVQKPTYFAEPIEVTLDKAKILDISYNNSLVNTTNPASLDLHKDEITGQDFSFKLNNLSNKDFEILGFTQKNINLDSYYLNLDSTLSSLNSKVGETISKDNPKDFEISLKPSNDAKKLFNSIDITGSIVLDLKAVNSNKKFSVEIPLDILISVGEGVYSNNCLVVTGINNNWDRVVNSSTSLSQTFEIQNNCVKKEDRTKDIDLSSIEMKILNKEDRKGNFTVNINNQNTRLQEGVYKKVLNSLEGGEKVMAEITYDPETTRFGDIQTEIYLNGTVVSESGTEFVNDGDSEKISTANFKILNLADCIEFYDGSSKVRDMLVFDTLENDTKELTIKNECASGDLQFDLDISSDNEDSSKGISYKYLQTNADGSYTLENIGAEETIKIDKPEVPGAYKILFTLKSLNENGRAVATVIKMLKLNVKDKLYMEDPFIEVYKDSSSFRSANNPKIFNRDIEKNAIEYFKDYTIDVDQLNAIDYSSLEDSSDYSNNLLLNLGTSHLVGGGTAVVGAGVLLASGVALSAGTLAIPIALYGIGAMGFNVFVSKGLDIKEHVLAIKNIGQDNIVDLIETKEINISNLDMNLPGEYPLLHLNVNDITGERFKEYYKDYYNVEGRVAKKKNSIDLDVYNCSYLNSDLEPLSEDNRDVLYKRIDAKECFVDPNLKDTKKDKYVYTITCPEKTLSEKRKYKVAFYKVCKYDEDKWPEQAGYQPLAFNLIDDAYNILSNPGYGEYYKTVKIGVDSKTQQENIDLNNYSVDSDIENKYLVNKNYNTGAFRFAFNTPQPIQEVTYDLNVYDCQTDSGKSGKTGPGMVPKVDFDWKFDLNSINNCQDNYCDATQLSIEVLNRINKAKEFLDNQNIQCPKSIQEVIDESKKGKYVLDTNKDSFSNQIPAGKIGISDISLKTNDNNMFISQIEIENRNQDDVNGSLDLSLGNHDIYKYTYWDYSKDDYVEENVGQPNKTIDTFVKQNDSVVYTVYFKDKSSTILSNNLDLVIEYDSYFKSSDNLFESIIDLKIHQGSTSSGCQVPATTVSFNNRDFIDSWFNDAVSPQTVNSAWTQSDINTFKNILRFEARLMPDNYSQSFKDAFDIAYGGKASKDDLVQINSFLAAPNLYQNDYLSPLFRDHLEFNRKYSINDVSEIKAPGMYDIRIDLSFDNKDWRFVNQNNEVDLNGNITFDFIRSPEVESIFYRLPFDGFVGYNNQKYNRSGYGLGYLGDDVLVSKNQTKDIRTKNDNGNPFSTLVVNKEEDLFNINSDIENRGNVLKIEYKDQDEFEMNFTPSSPVPIIANIKDNPIGEEFSAYYKLQEEGDILFGAPSLTRWNAVSDNQDFSGQNVQEVFNNVSDNAVESFDNINNGYKLTWNNPVVSSNIKLRTILYTLDSKNYTIISESQGTPDLDFSVDGKKFETAPGLPQSLSVNSIKDVFEKVKNKEICVVRSNNSDIEEYFWNPREVYNSVDLNAFTGN